MVAYTDAAPGSVCNRLATRAMLEHLAAELTVAGHQDAAGWLLGQLCAEVIPLRPRTEEPA
ncbi:MAG: hypothetical protein EBS91_04850 [Betaproteobacteria bacterium]|nr:hypothetical protein [Betaproteobacteria bacterium]